MHNAVLIRECGYLERLPSPIDRITAKTDTAECIFDICRVNDVMFRWILPNVLLKQGRIRIMNDTRLDPSTCVLEDGDVGRSCGLQFSPLHSGANELEEAINCL